MIEISLNGANWTFSGMVTFVPEYKDILNEIDALCLIIYQV
jgi:hypothetical protein